MQGRPLCPIDLTGALERHENRSARSAARKPNTISAKSRMCSPITNTTGGALHAVRNPWCSNRECQVGINGAIQMTSDYEDILARVISDFSEHAHLEEHSRSDSGDLLILRINSVGRVPVLIYETPNPYDKDLGRYVITHVFFGSQRADGEYLIHAARRAMKWPGYSFGLDGRWRVRWSLTYALPLVPEVFVVDLLMFAKFCREEMDIFLDTAQEART